METSYDGDLTFEEYCDAYELDPEIEEMHEYGEFLRDLDGEEDN
jgi:hypothetical protein